MVSERDRILDVSDYLESLGIEVNIGKNKARGNKGFFKVIGKKFRIDISKEHSKEESIKVLAHEFAHYVHYCNDKKLQSLNFIFANLDATLQEELITLTVDLVPKDSAKYLFDIKFNLKQEINNLTNLIRQSHPDFKSTVKDKYIESKLKFPFRYLLKYDRVKVADKLYSLEDVKDNELYNYLALQSKKRALKRVNSKISRLNKYYNSPTELFARAFEYYVSNEELLKQKAPNVYKAFKSTDNKLLVGFIDRLN